MSQLDKQHTSTYVTIQHIFTLTVRTQWTVTPHLFCYTEIRNKRHVAMKTGQPTGQTSCSINQQT